jgi:hypothetical protein
MHACRVPDQDDTRRTKRSTGLPSISTAAFEGAIDRPILHYIGHATKCTERHVLREKEELCLAIAADWTMPVAQRHNADAGWSHQ